MIFFLHRQVQRMWRRRDVSALSGMIGTLCYGCGKSCSRKCPHIGDRLGLEMEMAQKSVSDLGIVGGFVSC